MKTVHLKLKENGYKIVIGNKCLPQIGKALRALKLGHDALVITNPNINKYHGASLKKGLKRGGFSVKVFEVPEGEKSKSSAVAMKLIEKIAAYDIKKKPFIIAFGGGVVGDLAGFVAAVYKRGIPYVQVPTTLLAQIDSAIGGKVAIDLPLGKNLVGAFYQPKIVFSDVSVLRTLTIRQIRNGLAEAVKYGVIRDKKLFDDISHNSSKLLKLNPQVLMRVVVSCSQIKANVVMSDEKETRGIRTILNFGHTVGHAIESAGKYNNYHHGEAIALGMRVAAEISWHLGMLSLSGVLKIDKVLDDIGLPKRIKKTPLQDILKTMQHDKKFRAGKNRFVLATRIGKVKVVEGVRNGVIEESIKKHM